MRAEAASWDDWSVSNPPPIADDEKWHVQFAADEVKVVSLEQLDDLFRLSIVDSETQVWQSGMSQWQPLRVIAGLDEQPVSQSRRAPPKPPTRTAAPSVRPAPPAPRPAPPSVRPPAPQSVRPAPPAARPTQAPARPAYVASASFYPEAIQATPSVYPPQVAYAAPLAFAATMPASNSVRPLVVSQPPPMARGGGGFGRFLIFLSLIAGVSITAYRNDFLREGAHAAHQDALYTRLETALGGPAFGTVRALEQSAAAEPSLDLSSGNEAAVRMAIPSPTPTAPSTEAAATRTTPPVVSVESLAPEKKGLAGTVAPAPAPAPAPVAPAVTHARAAASFAQPKQAAASAPAKAAPTRVAAPAKAAVEKPAPQKSASEMTERERLNAAIGQSMMQADAPKSKGKSKSKSKGNEYDPLNPTL